MTIVLILNCSSGNSSVNFDKSQAFALAKNEILGFLFREGESSPNTKICSSNRIIWPAYMGFSVLLNCENLDREWIGSDIYKGNTCEDQYVYNLQHKYVDPWESGTGEFNFIDSVDLDSCPYIIFFSDFQHQHVYAAVVNNNHLIENNGPMLMFEKAKEFMVKFSSDWAKIEWIESSEIIDSSFLQNSQ